MSKQKIILLGKKLGMTQVYDNAGRLIPVTVVQAGPCPVTQVRTTENDGYQAVQIAFKAQKPERLTKPALKHLEKAGVEAHAYLTEFRTIEGFQPGDVLTVGRFAKGDLVDVIGTTKGRGFQGVMKRWGFHGGPASHGSMFHRRGGSYGCRQEPGEIRKNRKMPGHMGCESRTVQNLEVIDVLEAENLILIKGSFPGFKGGLVYVRSAKKA